MSTIPHTFHAINLVLKPINDKILEIRGEIQMEKKIESQTDFSTAATLQVADIVREQYPQLNPIEVAEQATALADFLREHGITNDDTLIKFAKDGLHATCIVALKKMISLEESFRRLVNKFDNKSVDVQ